MGLTEYQGKSRIIQWPARISKGWRKQREDDWPEKERSWSEEKGTKTKQAIAKVEPK